MKKVIISVFLATACAFLFVFIFSDGINQIDELTFVEAEFVDYCSPHSGKYFSGYMILSDGNKYSLSGGIDRKVLSRYDVNDLEGKYIKVAISGKTNIQGAYIISYLSIDGDEILTLKNSNKSNIWGYVVLIFCCDSLVLICNYDNIRKYINSIIENRKIKKRKKRNQLRKEARLKARDTYGGRQETKQIGDGSVSGNQVHKNDKE